MKISHILCILLLFGLSAEAQSFKSSLSKTIIAVNSILSQNKQAYFTDHEKNRHYLRKINASIQGDVFCIDSLANDDEKYKQKIFNLLEIKYFKRSENQINVIYEKDKKNGVISNVRVQDIYALRKELSALQVICTQYSEQDPRFKCD
jgi:hypothetical protein